MSTNAYQWAYATVPDIFQEKMGTLMHDLEYVRAYIDDLLMIMTSGSDLKDHLDETG